MAKIILNQHVANLGEAGDIVEVKNGYARNYLLPRGIATVWSKGAERQVESIRAAREARAQHNLEDAQALAEKLSGTLVTVPAKAGAEGRLFGTVKPADVSEAMEAAGLGQIDKRTISIESSIKRTGRHTVIVRLHEEVSASVEIDVVAS